MSPEWNDPVRSRGARLPGALLVLALFAAASWAAHAQDSIGAAATVAGEQAGRRGAAGDHTVFVPRVDRPPRLEDFTSMRPELDLRSSYALIDEFTQRIPSDGEPARHPTRVLLGYDDDNLYAVFLAFDDDPEAIRARMARREEIDADDHVWIVLDPFLDRQRGYEFGANAFGVQRDGLLDEGQEVDFSYDTLWQSEGGRTDRGYVVIFSIPFRSLRFPNRDVQTWGIVLGRWVPRGASEESYWPPVSSRVEGTLSQAGAITGLTDVAAGRNIRLIPFGTFRSLRSLATGLPGGPDFVSDLADPAAGLDAKVVLKDSLVVDATFNPDFSQVESDQPQTTVNERFEVFFPEKRPFFLENANFFRTPLDLLFTRRIADPRAGLRTTGKLGRWAVGALAIDDQAPGRLVPEGAAARGESARIGVMRIARDVGKQNRIGALWVERRFAGGRNRVAGVDGRFRFGDQWTAELQAVASESVAPDGSVTSGPGYVVDVARTGRDFEYRATYTDLDEGFRVDTGFVPRVGIRRLEQRLHYRIWSEGRVVQSWGPNAWFDAVWDREGELLDFSYNPWIGVRLAGNTHTGVFVWGQRTRLRPIDFPVLGLDRTYDHRRVGFWLNTQLLRWLEIDTWHDFGPRLNFVPATGQEPEIGPGRAGQLAVDLRPGDRTRFGLSWLYSTLFEPTGRERAFRNDILRLRLDHQVNRRLSLRAIGQLEAVTANPRHTRLIDRRNLNLDLLVTYLVNPWTSVYLGYNRNAQNLELVERDGLRSLRRTTEGLLPDADQLFLKVSYLFNY